MSFGQITKLTVNIGKCQTHITYVDHSTRFLMSNPSGFVFRSLDVVDGRRSADSAGQVVGFLERHFGRSGSIKKTLSLREKLLTVGLDDYAHYTTHHLEEQQRLKEQQQRELAEQKRQQQQELHTWQLEQLPKLRPQRATKLVPLKGQRHVVDLAWHLENCKWRRYTGIEFQLPKCHCMKIKETMDYINELVNTAMPDPQEGAKQQQQQQQQLKHNNQLMPDMNANLISINSLLQELNELLELQNQEQVNVQL